VKYPSSAARTSERIATIMRITRGRVESSSVTPKINYTIATIVKKTVAMPKAIFNVFLFILKLLFVS
jgi:hypothetical protein